MRTLATALMLTAALALTASASGSRFSSRGSVRHLSQGPFRVSNSSTFGSSGVTSHFGSGSLLQSHSASFGSSGTQQLSLAHWMFSQHGLSRIASGSSGSGSSTGSGQAQQLPAGSFGTVPGALLRSEGVGYLYAPGDSGRFFAVNAGNQIAFQNNLGYNTSGTGTFIGAPDSAPHGPASGTNAITPNQ